MLIESLIDTSLISSSQDYMRWTRVKDYLYNSMQSNTTALQRLLSFFNLRLRTFLVQTNVSFTSNAEYYEALTAAIWMSGQTWKLVILLFDQVVSNSSQNGLFFLNDCLWLYNI